MNYASLVKAIQSATTQLQGRVATVANQALVLRNWLVGAYLIEFEQNGKERAKYLILVIFVWTRLSPGPSNIILDQVPVYILVM